MKNNYWIAYQQYNSGTEQISKYMKTLYPCFLPIPVVA